MEIEGRKFTERRTAGAVLLTKIRMAVRERDLRGWAIGRIGGFDLVCRVHRALLDHGCAAALTLERTGYDQEIEAGGDLTALGLIARLEHTLDRFEDELEEQARRKRMRRRGCATTNRGSVSLSRCRTNSTRSGRAWRN